jgi:ABC-2 type transport system ATP-binding protein
MSPAIEAQDLRKTYQSGLLFPKRFEALKGLTLSVAQGEIFGLLGQNGAGKTTFIKTLLGIIRPTSGTASILGYPAGDRRSRRLIGYLPENLRVPRHLSAITALEYYGHLSGLSSAHLVARRMPLLERVGLAARAKDSVATYSKGMLQRLGLAQAMLHDPELYVLDEPTDGLDPVARADVRRMLKELKDRGKTVFLNSHILQEVELVCDRVAILNRGELKRLGRVAELTAVGIGGLNGAAATLEIQFDLDGPEASIREVLPPECLHQWQPFGPTQFRVTLRLAEQSEVNQIVDALRSRGISLIGLARGRVTLEDAYLQAVAEPAGK